MKAHRGLSDLQAILEVTGKELRSSLRDRQTAIYTLVLPICLFPVMFWIMIPSTAEILSGVNAGITPVAQTPIKTHGTQTTMMACRSRRRAYHCRRHRSRPCP